MSSASQRRSIREAFARRSGLALLVWLSLLLGLLFPYFESTRNANELPRLVQAMALVDEGSWAIDGRAARGIEVGPDVARSDVDRRLYPNKPPGTTVVTAAAYRIARARHGDALDLRTYTWWARGLAGVLPTVLLGWLVFRRYAPGFGSTTSGAAALLLVLGTPLTSYAHLLYGHALAAVLLFAGVSCLLDANPSASTRGRYGRAAAGGMLAGAAVTVEYGAVFAALPIAGLLLSRVRRPGGALVLVVALVGALVPIAGLAAYHDAVFGSPWATGYHHVTNADFAEKHGQGLLGLGTPSAAGFSLHMLSMDGGLLWWAPTIVVSVYGLMSLSLDHEHPAVGEARVHLALLLLYVLIVSSLSFEGGWRVGPRYLVAVLPSLAIGWAHALSFMRTHTVAMAALATLGVYALAVNALAANLWPHFDLTNIHQPVAEVLLPLWRHQYLPYTSFEWLPPRVGLRFVLLASVAGTAAVLYRASVRGARMAAAVGLGSIAGLLLMWATMLATPHPVGTRNLAYIQRIWEPVRAEGRPARASRPLPSALPPARPGQGREPVIRINRSADRPTRGRRSSGR